mgnify:CR=1 FL=1
MADPGAVHDLATNEVVAVVLAFGRRRQRAARDLHPPARQSRSGITVIDAYSVKPLAKDVIRSAAQKTRNLVLTVEDHYPEGGLGDRHRS